MPISTNKFDIFINKIIKLTKYEKISWSKTTELKLIDKDEDVDDVYCAYTANLKTKNDSKQIVLFSFLGGDYETGVYDDVDLALVDDNKEVFRIANDLSEKSDLWRLLRLVKRRVVGVDPFIDTFIEET